MFWPARKPETLLQRTIYKFHPTSGRRFRDLVRGSSTKSSPARASKAAMSCQRVGIVLIGMGERTTHQAVGQVVHARQSRSSDTVIACVMPVRARGDASRHRVQLCDRDKCTVFREVVDQIACYSIYPTGTDGRSRFAPTMPPARGRKERVEPIRCTSSKPAAMRGRPSGSSGTTAITSSPWSPASWWRMTATPTRTRCSARLGSR